MNHGRLNKDNWEILFLRPKETSYLYALHSLVQQVQQKLNLKKKRVLSVQGKKQTSNQKAHQTESI